MVTFEEWVVPFVNRATAVDLGMVCSCVAVAVDSAGQLLTVQRSSSPGRSLPLSAAVRSG
jgi:hypothetical protein